VKRPPSPLIGTLIQEEIPLDEGYRYWMLVACILLNRTRGKCVREPLRLLMTLSGSSKLGVLRLTRAELEAVIRPLGLWRQRARTLVRFTVEFTCRDFTLKGTSDLVPYLPGCGLYAAQSWAIFVEHRRDVTPDDVRLQQYLAMSAMG
jgi:endonuclease III